MRFALRQLTATRRGVTPFSAHGLVGGTGPDEPFFRFSGLASEHVYTRLVMRIRYLRAYYVRVLSTVCLRPYSIARADELMIDAAANQLADTLRQRRSEKSWRRNYI